MNKQTSSHQLIESIERDPASTFWLLDQVRRIDERDICDLMRDVAILGEVLDLKWDMTKNFNRESRRAEQAKMVDDFLAGKCEHPI